jgi:hypothetical protein
MRKARTGWRTIPLIVNYQKVPPVYRLLNIYLCPRSILPLLLKKADLLEFGKNFRLGKCNKIPGNIFGYSIIYRRVVCCSRIYRFFRNNFFSLTYWGTIAYYFWVLFLCLYQTYKGQRISLLSFLYSILKHAKKFHRLLTQLEWSPFPCPLKQRGVWLLVGWANVICDSISTDSTRSLTLCRLSQHELRLHICWFNVESISL